MIKRGLIIIASLLLLSVAACLLYLFFPPKPKAEWNTSPGASIIMVDRLGRSHVDYGYIPDARVWGDGRIIWVEYDSGGRRRVLEGHLSTEAMAQLINQFIEAGFFKGHRRFNWGGVLGPYVEIWLSDAHHTIAIGGTSDYDNESVLELVALVKSGAGTEGVTFTPTEGTLFAFPREKVDVPPDAEARFQWPDEEFGYGLEQVYESGGEIEITGKELTFAWEIVSYPASLVESGGQVYWIAVVVPGIMY